MSRALIESVPNISEGRRRDVVEEIAACASNEGCHVIDTSLDPDHNRSVITLVGEKEVLTRGILALVAKAIERIDLRTHRGAHPRMGAVDVIPFVPVEGVSMQDCVLFSKAAGKRIADEFGVPVYLYEESASCEERRNLSLIREGEFEGFPEKIKDPRWRPDFGPTAIHPTAGAMAVGAREFLVAFNVNLATSDLRVAKKIAAAIRFSSGGLRYVKALGFPLEERGIVQVSMNLTDFKKTPILRAFEMVKREAERHGVMVKESEIVGMVPRAALYAVAAAALQLEGFSPRLVLEERIEEAFREDR
jgi:glutamate formiminotransferase